MKKIVLFIAASVFCGTMYGQNVVIQTTNQNNSNITQNGEFFINGISSREDVGGVETYSESHYMRSNGRYAFLLSLTNHNSIAVTVLWEATDGYSKISGSTILQANEKKYVAGGNGGFRHVDYDYSSVATITRRLK